LPPILEAYNRLGANPRPFRKRLLGKVEQDASRSALLTCEEVTGIGHSKVYDRCRFRAVGDER
jgi:hypothetical protein